jgi:uncharacterized protein YegP (UPF0339 family)
MPGKFVIKKGSSGQFHFNLVSTNGQVVATSETYTTKESCKEGIESVRRLAPDATVDDQS